MRLRSDIDIAQLAQMACIWEVCAAKPGNVTRDRDFQDTSISDFLLSAVAIGPAFQNATRLSVGEIIRNAVADTCRLVRSNTNLGIVLLLAPLAKACLDAPHTNVVRQSLTGVLKTLCIEDARLAFSAIRLAKPGGMGRVPESDISEEPSITLLQAMLLARNRDSIASEYATDYDITFEIGLPALKSAVAEGAEFSRAIVHSYLTILSRVPDTLIARKKDAETARLVSLRAAEVLNKGGIFTREGEVELNALDRMLRDPGHSLNPGTTADLTTAAIFLTLFDRASLPIQLENKVPDAPSQF